MSGLFITIEGIEGSGKSTQIQLLADYLEGLGFTVTRTREPGGTPLAEDIRDLLLDRRDETVTALGELLLYEAARAQHVAMVIAPALARDEVVLCDRFADSTTAYQGAGRQLAADVITRLNELAAGDAWPTRTFLIDLPAEEGLGRARRRGSDDRMMGETLAFHQRIRNEFLALAQREPKRITIIDGTDSVENIQRKMRADVDQLPWIRERANKGTNKERRTSL